MKNEVNRALLAKKNLFRNILIASVILSLNCADAIAAAMPNPAPIAQTAAEKKKKEAEKKKKEAAKKKAAAAKAKQKAAAKKKKEADKKIRKIDKHRSEHYHYYTCRDWDNARNYDLCLNSADLGFEGCVEAIKSYIEVLKNVKK
mgnify:CR=1 FL=1